MIESHSFLEFRQNRGGTEAAYFPKLQPNISRMIHFQFSKEGGCTLTFLPWSSLCDLWYTYLVTYYSISWGTYLVTYYSISWGTYFVTYYSISWGPYLVTYYSISWGTYLVTVLFHLVRYLLGDDIIPSSEVPTWWLYYSISWDTYLVTVLFHLVRYLLGDSIIPSSEGKSDINFEALQFILNQTGT